MNVCEIKMCVVAVVIMLSWDVPDMHPTSIADTWYGGMNRSAGSRNFTFLTQ